MTLPAGRRTRSGLSSAIKRILRAYSFVIVFCFGFFTTCVLNVVLFPNRQLVEEHDKRKFISLAGNVRNKHGQAKKQTPNHDHLPHHVQVQKKEKQQKKLDWLVVYPDASDPPYTRFAPHLNLIWERGWYNVFLPPEGMPINYYNKLGLDGKLTEEEKEWISSLSPQGLCDYYLSIRHAGLNVFTENVLPKLPRTCNLTLIVSEMDKSMSAHDRGLRPLLRTSKIKAIYAQNVVKPKENKLVPIPIGVPIHYGFVGSPDSLHTVEQMMRIREEETPIFTEKKTAILFDYGQVTSPGSIRTIRRNEAQDALTSCPSGLVTVKARCHPLDNWHYYGNHTFAAAPSGFGWDTFRLWELLFFGTVPIVKSSPLDLLLVPAHVPVVIVENWSDVCEWNSKQKWHSIVQQYKGWIANAHFWLEPSLWVPRNQTRMEELCDASPNCREVYEVQKHFIDKWK